MKKVFLINKKINFFRKKIISVDGDKSLSIRFVLLSSLSQGKCIAKNLLKSEDVHLYCLCNEKNSVFEAIGLAYCCLVIAFIKTYVIKKSNIVDMNSIEK